MPQILSIVAPVYIAIGVGYLAVRKNVLTGPDLRMLGKFVVTFALPAMMFKALLQQDIGRSLHPTYLAAYLIGSVVAFATGFGVYRIGLRRSAVPSIFAALGMSASNSAFIGFPLVLQVAPSVAPEAFAMNMMVENLALLPTVLILASRADGQQSAWMDGIRTAIWRTAKNPMIVALGLGICASLAHLTLPEPAQRTLAMFAVTSTGLSLFVIGGTLAGVKPQGLMTRIAPISVGKLVGHPVLVAAAMSLLATLGARAIPHDLALAGLVMASVPMVSIYPILAQAHGAGEDSAAALFLTTVSAFFTLSAVIWMIQAGIVRV